MRSSYSSTLFLNSRLFNKTYTRVHHVHFFTLLTVSLPVFGGGRVVCYITTNNTSFDRWLGHTLVCGVLEQ